ncbi:MAG: GTP-binding protein [archaeon]|nr:GTP-binding protein [archaeon]
MENPDVDDYKVEILPGEYNIYDLSFKIIVIGDSGVGKSCLTLKATKDYFEDYYSATVGFEFFTFNVKIDNRICKLQIWDTCGQEIYRSLISSFYRNSSLAMMVYAIDNLDSFDHISSWLNEIKTQSNPDVKVFLIGNKSDLENKRKVPKELADKFCEENKLDLMMETSAKTGFNR